MITLSYNVSWETLKKNNSCDRVLTVISLRNVLSGGTK